MRLWHGKMAIEKADEYEKFMSLWGLSKPEIPNRCGFIQVMTTDE